MKTNLKCEHKNTKKEFEECKWDYISYTICKEICADCGIEIGRWRVN